MLFQQSQKILSSLILVISCEWLHKHVFRLLNQRYYFSSTAYYTGLSQLEERLRRILEITGELNSLTIVLRRIQAEAELSGSLLNRKDEDHSDLVRITRNCRPVVVKLRDIVEKYEGLGKSRWRNWDRLRLGNRNLADLRGKLMLHTSSLSTYLIIHIPEYCWCQCRWTCGEEGR